MAGNRIVIIAAPAVRRRLVARARAAGTLAVAVILLAIGVVGFIVLQHGPSSRGPVTQPGSEARAKQRQGQMARLARWHELRRQARAHGIESPPAVPAHDANADQPAPIVPRSTGGSLSTRNPADTATNQNALAH